MKNEKLIKTAKSLDSWVKFGYWMFLVAGIFFAVMLPVLLLQQNWLYQSASWNLSLRFVNIQLSESLQVDSAMVKLQLSIGFGFCVALFFLLAYVCKLLRRILEPMKEGKPFEAGIADKFRRLAWVTTISSVVFLVAGLAAQFLIGAAYPWERIFAPDAVAKIEISPNLSLGLLFIPAFLFFLSYIFRYGEALQQESDETL